MLRLLLSCLVFLPLALFAQEAQRIAFVRGEAIWVAGLDGKGAKKVTKGDWPDLSPDGTRIAFNTQDNKTFARCIATADVATGKVSLFRDLPSDNCYAPVWSPDGTALIFNILTDSNWNLGYVAADGTGFRYLKKADGPEKTYYSAAWAADGKSFFCQDLVSLHQFALDGTRIRQWRLEEILPKQGFGSGLHISASPDGAAILLDADNPDEDRYKNVEGPVPNIWLIELATGKASRVSKKGAFAMQPCWIAPGEYLFAGQGLKDREPSIYRGRIGNDEVKVVMSKAMSPSVSRRP